MKNLLDQIELVRKTCSFSDPKLRYISDEQANEWLKIGKSTNTHTQSTENKILKSSFHKIFKDLKRPLAFFDLGCGDGRKVAQLIFDLEGNQIEIDAYTAVDVNQKLIDASIKLVIKNTKLEKNKCFSIQSSFESLTSKFKKQENSEKNDKVYLLLGNTFNNFKSQEIASILNEIVKTNDKLIIGVKCRVNSSGKERSRIIQEYSSYGPDFTYSFGHLLGLSDEDMKRVVKYNSKKNVLEIYLNIRKPSRFMRLNGISKCKELHVFNSYKPTIKEMKATLSHFFNIRVFSTIDSTEAIFFCKK